MTPPLPPHETSVGLPRAVTEVASTYLDSFRVVVLNGPRQAGKTTIMRQLLERHGGELRNLDEEALVRSARRDPAGFVQSVARPLMIDEVQRAGDTLVHEIKARVDGSNRRGQFLLAGSTRFLSVPTLSESLAGRAGVLEVWPFSQGELEGVTSCFIDAAFDDAAQIRDADAPGLSRADYLSRIEIGGFPKPAGMSHRRVRGAWFSNYVASVVERDIREMARINEPSAAETVLRVLAALDGQTFVTATVSSRAELSRATVERYVGLLETVFLVFRLRPWSRNSLAQVVKHPKVHLVDAGLACHLVGADANKLTAPDSPVVGGIMENFVVTEIAKQATWSDHEVRLAYYRDVRGNEVDLIVEHADGRLLALEAKAALTVTDSDFRQLRVLRDKLGNSFVHGFVVYLGDRILSFGRDLTAIPLGMLWTITAQEIRPRAPAAIRP